MKKLILSLLMILYILMYAVTIVTVISIPFAAILYLCKVSFVTGAVIAKLIIFCVSANIVSIPVIILHDRLQGNKKRNK